jgi:predicted DsbA family dithiol-disulfide isomerase
MTPGSRRGFLALFGAMLALAVLPRVWPLLRGPGQAQPHPQVRGFSILDAGPVSSQIDPLAGIPDPDADRIAAAKIGDVCAALFRQQTVDGAVPVAFFTDINCPFCRAMERWLQEVPATEAAVTWHDLPLLGNTSVAAARAVAAAGLQGKADAMRARLHRTRFTPDPTYLRALAGSLDLDPDRLLAAMYGPQAEAGIAQSLGLSALFGFPGTPALVVGGAVAVGQRSREEFEQLLAAARNGEIPVPCG